MDPNESPLTHPADTEAPPPAAGAGSPGHPELPGQADAGSAPPPGDGDAPGSPDYPGPAVAQAGPMPPAAPPEVAADSGEPVPAEDRPSFLSDSEPLPSSSSAARFAEDPAASPSAGARLAEDPSAPPSGERLVEDPAAPPSPSYAELLPGSASPSSPFEPPAPSPGEAVPPAGSELEVLPGPGTVDAGPRRVEPPTVESRDWAPASPWMPGPASPVPVPAVGEEPAPSYGEPAEEADPGSQPNWMLAFVCAWAGGTSLFEAWHLYQAAKMGAIRGPAFLGYILLGAGLIGFAVDAFRWGRSRRRLVAALLVPVVLTLAGIALLILSHDPGRRI